MLTLALSTLFASAVADQLINNNWYGKPVQRIAYSGVGGDGSYNRIISMDSNAGTCGSVPQPFSGPLAPLDEDLSIHFRGPLKLKQFAVYMPTSSPPPSKRSIHGRHAHANFHTKRAVGDTVTATIDGKVVTWANKYDGKQSDNVWVTATINGDVVSWMNDYHGPTSAPAPSAPACPAPAPAPPAPKMPVLGPAPSHQLPPAQPMKSSQPRPNPVAPPANGDWAQIAYYNADDKTARNITFLNNRGGQGSGVWNSLFGSSLSYASVDGDSSVASPVVFGGELVSGNVEIGIFSEQDCSTVDCGFVRPGAVAYKGFAGNRKAFFMEFMMPDDGTTGDVNSVNNKPAVWALNGQIPRVGQYLPQKECSCWPSGCGEFDIFETLDPGNTRCKSTMHNQDSKAGGSNDYFNRPTTTFIKVAAIMTEDGIVVQELPNDFNFGTSIPAAQIAQLRDNSQSNVKGSTYAYQ